MTSAIKPRVIAIYRVSTEEQADEDRAGLPRQREAVARVVEQHGLDVISEIELAGVSGTNVSSSPEFVEMLRKVRNREIDGVVVSSLDRLARPDTFESMAVLDHFTDAKASIYAEGEVINLATKEGKLTASIKLAMHGFDRSNIVERSASAKEIKRKKGECPGPPTILPLGVAYDRKTRIWSYTDDIKVVQDAFRLFDEEKITNLTRLANEVGLQRNTLAKILRNPIYKGWRIYDQRRSEDKHVVKNPRTPLKQNETVRFSRKKVPRAEKDIIRIEVFKEPAVDPETFDRVQFTLAENRSAWLRENIPTAINLAVGIGYCAHCGRRLYASSGKRGEGRESSYSYYLCANNHYKNKAQGRECIQTNMRKEVIDGTLTEFAAAPRLTAAGAAAFHPWIGGQFDIDARLGFSEAVTDGFDGKTGKVLHMAQQCFNGKLNGGCGVVCCVATPSNARGRHSQAQVTRRIQSGKAEGICRAKPIAVYGRSPQPLSSGPAYKSPADTVGRQMTRFYAAGPLDSGEERASSHIHGPFTAQNPHRFC